MEVLGPQRATRSAEAGTPPLSRKEVKSLPDQDVSGTEEGMHYLESTLLTVLGVLYTAEVLVRALFQISMLPGIKGSKANTNAVRAVAYVLAGLDTDDKAQAIAGAVADQLTGQIGEVREKAVAAVSEAAGKLNEAANLLKEQSEGVVENIEEGLKKAVGDLRANAAELTETTVSYRDVLKCASPPTPTTAAGPRNVSLLAPRLQAREGIWAQQVLVDLGTADDPGPPEEFLSGSPLTLK